MEEIYQLLFARIQGLIAQGKDEDGNFGGPVEEPVHTNGEPAVPDPTNLFTGYLNHSLIAVAEKELKLFYKRISGIAHIDFDDYMVYRFLSNCGATVEQRLDDIYPWLAKFLFDPALTDEQIREAGLLVEAEINRHEQELIRVRAAMQEERRVLRGYRAIQARNVLAHVQGMPPLNMANLELFADFAVIAFLHHERRTLAAARLEMYQRFLTRVGINNRDGYLQQEINIPNAIRTDYGIGSLIDAAFDEHNVQFFWADGRIVTHLQNVIPNGINQLSSEQENDFRRRVATQARVAHQVLATLHPDI